MHVKFDDKDLEDKTSKQDEGFAEIQVPEDIPEPGQSTESEDSLKAAPTSVALDDVAPDEVAPDDVAPDEVAPDEVASDEAQNGSQQADSSNYTFKYKYSHPQDQIIGSKDSPRRTRSHFRQEESMCNALVAILLFLVVGHVLFEFINDYVNMWCVYLFIIIYVK